MLPVEKDMSSKALKVLISILKHLSNDAIHGHIFDIIFYTLLLILKTMDKQIFSTKIQIIFIIHTETLKFKRNCPKIVLLNKIIISLSQSAWLVIRINYFQLTIRNSQSNE